MPDLFGIRQVPAKREMRAIDMLPKGDDGYALIAGGSQSPHFGSLQIPPTSGIECTAPGERWNDISPQWTRGWIQHGLWLTLHCTEFQRQSAARSHEVILIELVHLHAPSEKGSPPPRAFLSDQSLQNESPIGLPAL
jgi:hypothetical protein